MVLPLDRLPVMLYRFSTMKEEVADLDIACACPPATEVVVSPLDGGAADESLAMLCKALAHPARVRIVRLLARRDSCVCGELVDEIDLAQSTVSQHLKILKEAGLIRGQIQGPRTCYCLEPGRLTRLHALLSSLTGDEEQASGDTDSISPMEAGCIDASSAPSSSRSSSASTVQGARMSAKPGLLVLCTGNSARSQMAASFLDQYAGDRFTVSSAGTEPAERVHPLTVEVMKEKGVDLSEVKPMSYRDLLGHEAVHTLVIVCDGAAKSCPSVWPGCHERLMWPFEDPAAAEGSHEEQLAVFRRIRDEIEAKVTAWAAA